MAEDKKIPSPEKLKALQLAMQKIDKQFGKGAIMKLGDDSFEDVDVIPTGSVGLNAALGVGGYPRGRIIEIYGPESSGKTTVALHIVAEVQKAGGEAALENPGKKSFPERSPRRQRGGARRHVSLSP